MKCPLSKQQRFRFRGIFTSVAIPALFLTYLCLHLSPMLFGDRQMRGKAVLQLCIWLPLTVMFFLCLFTTMSTHPGKVPESLKRDDQNDNYRLNCMETKKNGETRVCKKCEVPKPDRCHHCRACKLCILKMDRHCFYIRSCIGFYNYKSFVLCIIYAAMLCQFMLWTMAWSVVSYMNGTGPQTVKIWICAGEALLLILSLFLTFFSIFHLCLIRRGLTTIEFCEKKVRAGGIYDQGSWRNFTSIFGQVPVLWFFPWGKPHGDGMSFERNSCDEVQSKSGLLNPARRHPPMPMPVKAVQ